MTTSFKNHIPGRMCMAGICVSAALTLSYYCGAKEPEPDADAPTWHQVEEVRKPASLKRGATLSAKVHGRSLIAEIKWRPYNATLDGNVIKWYGDMGLPPPKYVVNSLTLSVDGTVIPIEKSKYSHLCSQWKKDETGEEMNFHKKGENVRLVVSLGDGGESWAAVYVIDLAKKSLISYRIDDGVAVSEEVIWKTHE